MTSGYWYRDKGLEVDFTWDSLASLCRDYWALYQALGGDSDAEDWGSGDPTEEQYAASSCVDEIAITGVARALEVVVGLAETAPSRKSLFFLGAGPLEELVLKHGDHLVGSLVETARNVPRFRIALSGVWPDTDDPLRAETMRLLGPLLREDETTPFE
jgi:hypothetical protein